MAAIAVYKITNNINGKMYFGQTSRPERRFKEHTWLGSKSKIMLCAIKKYGKENFTFDILCWCPNKEYADMVETKLIAVYNTRKHGYNICKGGEGLGTGPDNPVYGKKRSDEFKRKVSEAKKGDKNPSFGKPISDECKDKIRKSLLNRDITWGNKISEAKAGIRTCSLEELALRLEKANEKRRCPVLAKKGDEEYTFPSLRHCAAYFSLHEVTIQRYLRGVSRNSEGWVFTKVVKNGS